MDLLVEQLGQITLFLQENATKKSSPHSHLTLAIPFSGTHKSTSLGKKITELHS
jgi:hypothetical protein